MRIYRPTLVAAAFAFSGVASFAEAAEPLIEMAPSSRGWSIYAEESCALRRTFGSGDQQIVLELRQFSPDPIFQITVASETLTRDGQSARVRFEPDDGWFAPSSLQLVNLGEARGILYEDSLRQSADKRSSGATSEWPSPIVYAAKPRLRRYP